MSRVGQVILATGLALSACGGRQSALDPAGRGAEQIGALFWWMAGGGALIWLAVVALAIYAIHLEREPFSQRAATLLIIGGGAIFPTVVLAVLLVYGLAPLPDLLGPAPAGSLRISVTAEQWWWRVRYLPPGGPTVELANEIRLPVGQRVEFHLESTDVIHSFWIPSLGGKMDMIPGRANRLSLEATRTGVFRGTCAEYCGASHALMSFSVVVQAKDQFARWLAGQAAVARRPSAPLAARGQVLFLANGCAACHTVRGTPADGRIGPDLTHVGSRLSLAAGVLPNEAGGFARWIGSTDRVKPGVRMPAFGMLAAEDVRALAAYLDGLE